LRQQPVVLHHHPQLTDPDPGVHRMTAPGYSTAATPAEACPYDLMHALYGVLKPTLFSVRPAAVSCAIVITLAQPQLNAPVTVLERSDPPPRLV